MNHFHMFFEIQNIALKAYFTYYQCIFEYSVFWH